MNSFPTLKNILLSVPVTNVKTDNERQKRIVRESLDRVQAFNALWEDHECPEPEDGEYYEKQMRKNDKGEWVIECVPMAYSMYDGR